MPEVNERKVTLFNYKEIISFVNSTGRLNIEHVPFSGMGLKKDKYGLLASFDLASPVL